MRIFEILLLSICSILPFLIALKGIRQNRKSILILISSVLALHLIFEGYRWQMIPSYIILLILLWCSYNDYKFFKGNWLRKIISGFGLIIILLLGWALPITLPVFELPTPTGKFKVGSQYIHLETIEDEIFTPEPNDKRALMIKVWYPAELNDEETEAYLNDGDRIGFAAKYRLPKSTFNYLDAVKTHTFISPKVKTGKFPILVFSHGHYSKASGYYALIEEIVSHGYIVLNVNHTYESTGTLFPNGEIKLYHSEYDKIHNNQAMADMIWNTLQNFEKAKSTKDKQASIEFLVKNYFAAEITKRWSKDISLVIDAAEKWNTSSFLANHIDISKIGVFGHSQGGSAAGQAILNDDRIKAGINLDGVQWGTLIDSTLTKPFALVSSDWASNHPNFNEYIFKERSISDFYNAKLLKSGHPNFMDIPLIINFSLINESGPIKPSSGYEITNDFILQFFDNYLLNKPHNLMDLENKYENFEIEFSTNY